MKPTECKVLESTFRLQWHLVAKWGTLMENNKVYLYDRSWRIYVMYQIFLLKNWWGKFWILALEPRQKFIRTDVNQSNNDLIKILNVSFFINAIDGTVRHIWKRTPMDLLNFKYCKCIYFEAYPSILIYHLCISCNKTKTYQFTMLKHIPISHGTPQVIKILFHTFLASS